jgi:hypothetical protein
LVTKEPSWNRTFSRNPSDARADLDVLKPLGLPDQLEIHRHIALDDVGDIHLGRRRCRLRGFLLAAGDGRDREMVATTARACDTRVAKARRAQSKRRSDGVEHARGVALADARLSSRHAVSRVTTRRAR